MKAVNEQLPLYVSEVVSPPSVTALECPDFPFEELSEIAELESWRKEINRPVYHIHKWWAQRLGSVFRGLIIGALTPDPADVVDRFYEPIRFPNAVVYDPFMGSGTTVGEALKLGARAIGRDINHVAYLAVRNALASHSRDRILATYGEIERELASRIRSHYLTRIDDDTALGVNLYVEVLYYFWVMVVACPACHADVDLFSSYVFAQHAYPGKYPEAQAICPHCRDVTTVRYDAESATCQRCFEQFEPKRGPVRGAGAICPDCSVSFKIVEAVKAADRPPRYRMYAKLVLLQNGEKRYLRTTQYDEDLYAKASAELEARPSAYPVVSIQPGHNTDQVLNYCYRQWHEMFNDRQLLCLSLLAERISAIEDADLRSLFAVLFTGLLEFNNMFASYKGEGTGAVRHMFAHHVLKPERTPLEANVWGTPKSSGSFSTLFRNRLLRALEYRRNPFEIKRAHVNGKHSSEKVFGLSAALGHDVADNYAEFSTGRQLYLSCGDSAITDLPDHSVSVVLTDPPFFDNVHYSELADFFHVWQRFVLHRDLPGLPESTRTPREVQGRDASGFARRLGAVFAECRRVLQCGGLLVFTYHHSRPEGWSALLEALWTAGFVVTATHPMKSEMSTAAPKSQARHPIDVDIVFVCRSRDHLLDGDLWLRLNDLNGAISAAVDQIVRFNIKGRNLGRNDVKIIITSQVVRRLSALDSLDGALRQLTEWTSEIDRAADKAWNAQGSIACVGTVA